METTVDLAKTFALGWYVFRLFGVSCVESAYSDGIRLLVYESLATSLESRLSSSTSREKQNHLLHWIFALGQRLSIRERMQPNMLLYPKPFPIIDSRAPNTSSAMLCNRLPGKFQKRLCNVIV
eukprot:145732-Amphidinium_carterae.1